MLGLFTGSVFAEWSLLEDYQLNDVAGEEGLCLSSLKNECAFDIQQYIVIYPDDDLKDDMDKARDAGLEMIFGSFPMEQYVSLPNIVVTVDEPVPGDPFFQSGWYNPELSGWGKLWKNMLDSPPSP